MMTYFKPLLLLLTLFHITSSSEYTKINNGLTAVPGDTPGDTTELILSKNDITTIATDDISHLTSLIILDLSENKIKSIEPNVFSNLVPLEELILKNNRLTTLQTASFTGLYLTC